MERENGIHLANWKLLTKLVELKVPTVGNLRCIMRLCGQIVVVITWESYVIH